MLAAGERRTVPATGSITFDDQSWPLVIVTIVGQVSATQYEEFLTTQLVHLRRGQVLFIFDTSRSGTKLVDYRQRQVEWLREHEQLLSRSVIGAAFVITSPVIRLLANILHHFKPMSYPQLFARNLPEAVGWAEALLREAGHSIASDPRAECLFGLTKLHHRSSSMLPASRVQSRRRDG